MELKAVGASLLSREEFEMFRSRIILNPTVKTIHPQDQFLKAWWLADCKNCSSDVAETVDHCTFKPEYVNAIRGVRPLITLSESVSKDKVMYAGMPFTVLASGLALCDYIIAWQRFNEDWNSPYANKYEYSDIKKFVDNWFKSKGTDVSLDYFDVRDILLQE